MIDVCVVGGGVGGLAAARELVSHELSVVVLEARERLGGRLHSIGVADGALDLGATWFWPGEHRIAALVRELDVAVFDHAISGDALYDTGDAPQRLDGNPLDAPAGRFRDGANSLTRALADRMPSGVVRVACPAVGIEQQGHDWLVRTASEEIGCRHVVIAVPPALALATIAFTPALPAAITSLAASTPVWMGSTVKAVAQFDQSFWRQAGLSGSAISHVGPFREIHDMSGEGGRPAALFGFAPSPGPSAWSSAWSSAITVPGVVAQLVRLFGDAAGEPARVVVMDWRAEGFTSPANVGELTDYTTYGHRLYQDPMFDGRVHWASTECGPQQPGHIEGALAAAERSVRNIIDRDALDQNGAA